MQQVLEAPRFQPEIRKPSVIKRSQARVAPAPLPVRLIRSVMSLFSMAKIETIPGGRDRALRYESALDHACRVDPYLCIRSFAG